MPAAARTPSSSANPAPNPAALMNKRFQLNSSFGGPMAGTTPGLAIAGRIYHQSETQTRDNSQSLRTNRQPRQASSYSRCLWEHMTQGAQLYARLMFRGLAGGGFSLPQPFQHVRIGRNLQL